MRLKRIFQVEIVSDDPISTQAEEEANIAASLLDAWGFPDSVSVHVIYLSAEPIEEDGPHDG